MSKLLKSAEHLKLVLTLIASSDSLVVCCVQFNNGLPISGVRLLWFAFWLSQLIAVRFGANHLYLSSFSSLIFETRVIIFNTKDFWWLNATMHVKYSVWHETKIFLHHRIESSSQVAVLNIFSILLRQGLFISQTSNSEKRKIWWGGYKNFTENPWLQELAFLLQLFHGFVSFNKKNQMSLLNQFLWFTFGGKQ